MLVRSLPSSSTVDHINGAHYTGGDHQLLQVDGHETVHALKSVVTASPDACWALVRLKACFAALCPMPP